MPHLKERRVAITGLHLGPDTIQLRIVEGRLCSNSVNVNAIDRRSPHFCSQNRKHSGPASHIHDDM